MKRCVRCKIEKSEEEFHRATGRKDGRQLHCKLCKKAIDARTYANGGEEYRRRKQKRQQQAAAGNIRLVFAYLLQHPCVDCGEPDPLVLEFDHVRGEKKLNVSDLLHRYATWETIRAEIEKCEVRCANCHRHITAERRVDQRYLLGLEMLS